MQGRFLKMLPMPIRSLACFAWLVVASFVIGSPALAQRVSDAIDDTVRGVFQQAFDKTFCSQGKKASIGVWTLDEGKSPVGSAGSKRIYQEILARVIKAAPKCVAVIDSAAIGIIANHLQKSGALEENGGSVLAALGDTEQNVGFILFPDVFSQAGKVVFTLRIVERSTTRTLGLSTAASLPEALSKDSGADAAISLVD